VEQIMLKASRHINRTPAVNIHHATRYADRAGLSLNAFVTINFTDIDAGESASLAFRKLLNQRFAPWLRRTAFSSRVLAPTYVWSIENTRGTIAAHWLVHLPADVRAVFLERLPRWLEGITGSTPLSSTIQMKPIYSIIGLRRYILKGVNPVWATRLGVLSSDQGIVNGRRSGFSRNLGPVARAKGGYKPRRAWTG
jgi:hypothetical protein